MERQERDKNLNRNVAREDIATEKASLAFVIVGSVAIVVASVICIILGVLLFKYWRSIKNAKMPTKSKMIPLDVKPVRKVAGEFVK